MTAHKTNIQLRFVDVDAFGHLNNAHYLTYFEEARIKFLDDLFHWNYLPGKAGIILARAEIDFKMPGHYKDYIQIKTYCENVGTKSFLLDYEMIKTENEVEVILAKAKTVIVMFDYETNKSIEIPAEWKLKLSATHP